MYHAYIPICYLDREGNQNKDLPFGWMDCYATHICQIFFNYEVFVKVFGVCHSYVTLDVRIIRHREENISCCIVKVQSIWVPATCIHEMNMNNTVESNKLIINSNHMLSTPKRRYTQYQTPESQRYTVPVISIYLHDYISSSRTCSTGKDFERVYVYFKSNLFMLICYDCTCICDTPLDITSS